MWHRHNADNLGGNNAPGSLTRKAKKHTFKYAESIAAFGVETARGAKDLLCMYKPLAIVDTRKLWHLQETRINNRMSQATTFRLCMVPEAAKSH